jgi:1-acyl-sn-glycerol-3-phosphate acyltransferase
VSDFTTINYPRKRLSRRLLITLGRLIARTLFKVEISGEENFPDHGPLIVVGNHTAIMETVLLIIFFPRQVEMLGASDIPHEKFNQIVSDLYGFIPVNRGNIDRLALQAALRVLEQKGVLGIFPEGGIWDPGTMRAQTGVSWLSYRGATPVLPIGFSGTLGAIGQALKLKRPTLTMKVGQLIPPLVKQPCIPRRVLFDNYAQFVMSQVRALILPDDPSLKPKYKNERFEFDYFIQDQLGQQRIIPNRLKISHKTGLAKFLHRPAILKLFRSNLDLPITVLENLYEKHDPQAIARAVKYILDYLDNENPYLLSYRFGPKVGEEMLLGLRELLALSTWSANQDYRLFLIPIRYFFSLAEEKEIKQIKQHSFDHWM